MTSGPIRRAQLVAPFGVGAMVVVRDGTCLIGGGLDHWYERDGDDAQIDAMEFRVEEWRLARRLGVTYFGLPPDFREFRRGERVPNSGLTVPFLRFPQWHFCPGCYGLEKLPLATRGRVRCRECDAAKHRTRFLAQVPFVAMCEQGHIQDFPWREWAHRSANPACNARLRLVATGGASLASQRLSCECGAKRNLSGITEADSTGTYLSRTLAKGGGDFLCPGGKPWLGQEDGAGCDAPLRGSLRSASNVYFANVSSAIYLPRSNNEAPSELISLLEEPPLSTLINLLLGADHQITADDLRNQQSALLQTFTDGQIKAAIRIVRSNEGKPEEGPAVESTVPTDDAETAFRRAEYDVLRTGRTEEQLIIRHADLNGYGPDVAANFARIMLVEKLRETRALAGFSRVFPIEPQSADERLRLLWQDPPPEGRTWLPAYVVYGEGLFLEIDEAQLQAWEDRLSVGPRIQRLVENYQRLQQQRRLRDRPIEPRFVLLHTLSHLLINQLTFECGYSSAALRERLYVSANRSSPMAGLLIYTAAGDAEGTMGGLVRMGKQGYLEAVIRRALNGALWCSADPVCMEMGQRGGQGPDSCNLAACHNCALVPETACEEFNRFLDRALAVGGLQSPDLAFFQYLAS